MYSYILWDMSEESSQVCWFHQVQGLRVSIFSAFSDLINVVKNVSASRLQNTWLPETLYFAQNGNIFAPVINVCDQNTKV